MIIQDGFASLLRDLFKKHRITDMAGVYLKLNGIMAREGMI